MTSHGYTHTGYYRALRRVLELRVPPPDSAQCTSPLASSLLDYIKRPLATLSDARQGVPSPPSLSYNHFPFRAQAAVLSELFAPPLTAHVCYLILPSLSTLPLEPFVTSLSADLTASPEVLFLLLSLVHHQLGMVFSSPSHLPPPHDHYLPLS